MALHRIGRRVSAWMALATSLAVALLCAPVQGQRESAKSFEALAARAQAAREAGRAEEAIQSYKAAVELRPEWDEGLWYLGTLLYDANRFDEAIPALRKLLDLHPNAGPAHAFLGLCEFETGDYRSSFIHLQAAREMGLADSPEIEKVAYYHLGLLLNLRGEFESSTELLARVFGPNQFAEQIRTAMGLALLRVPILPSQLDPSKDAVVHAAGEAAVLIAQNDTTGALRRLEQVVRDFPGTHYLHYQYGLALARARQYEKAVQELQEETRISPESSLPWIVLASLAAERGNAEQAASHARKAVQMAPRSAAAHETLARVLKLQKKETDAAAALQRARELSAQPPEIESVQADRYALARAAKAQAAASKAVQPSEGASSVDSFDDVVRRAEGERNAGHLESAADAYQRALAMRPTWQEGWRQLGTIQYMRRQYADAIGALQQAVTLEAKQSDTWTLLGLSEFEVKDYKNALVHLERGRTLGFAGSNAAVRIARYHLALLLNQNGEFDRALDLLIPETAPGALSEEIQFAMGIALLRIAALPEQVDPARQALVRQAGEAAMLLSESRYDRAFPVIEKLLKEYPATPFLHYAYGDALASTSMYDEAKAQLQEEMKLNSDSVLPYLRLASVELQLRQSAEALAVARKAAAMAPESSEAHYLLGRALLDEGDTASSIRELEEARRLAPYSAKVHFNLARAYAKSDRRQEAEQARAEFERLNAMRPGQRKYYGERSSGEVTAEPAK